MQPQELNARAYCIHIGANPDEVIWGYIQRQFVRMPRWWWYRGAEMS
jgi:hypothetical protein